MLRDPTLRRLINGRALISEERQQNRALSEFAKLAGACGTLRTHDALSFVPTARHETRWL